MQLTKLMKKFKKTIKYFYYLVLVFLSLVAILVAVSALNIPDGYKLYTVQSGSMQPTISVGSLVIVKPVNDYKLEDIVTYQKEDFTTTHRIQEIKTENDTTFYITKGDANDASDSEPVFSNQVLGKVIFSLPFLGRPVAFAKTQTGFIFLIVIPATLIIYSEILVIKKEIQLIKQKQKTKKTKKSKK